MRGYFKACGLPNGRERAGKKVKQRKGNHTSVQMGDGVLQQHCARAKLYGGMGSEGVLDVVFGRMTKFQEYVS